MNIDNLTIGQIKEINSLLGCNSGARTETLSSSLTGKYVLVRTRNEGVNAGYVEKADETGIILKDARRIWYHRPADKSISWYEGVAISGLSSDSKISTTVERKVIIENYSITQCTDVAEKSIKEHKSHEQN